MKKLSFLTLILIVLNYSCDQKDEPIGEKTQFQEDFETIWYNFNAHYVFFQYKDIDWNETYDTYSHRMETVENYGDFISTLTDMLSPLEDVHVYLKNKHGGLVRPFFPSYTVNWDQHIWQDYMQEYNWHRGSASWGWFKKDSVGYFSFLSWDQDGIQLEEFDAALDSMRNCKGIIIDIRSNGGGYGPLAGSIGGRFVSDNFPCGYIQFRNGEGHDDFTASQPIEYPARGDWQFTKPIILLIGRRCMSTSEIFAAGMKNLETCTVIGDTTGGGLSNARYFTLSDGTAYTISDQLIMDTESNIVESRGIAPDIRVKWDPAMDASGEDPVFEYAMDLLTGE